MAPSATRGPGWIAKHTMQCYGAIRSHSREITYMLGGEVATISCHTPLTESCQSAVRARFFVRLERAHVVCSPLSYLGLSKLLSSSFFLLSRPSGCCYYHAFLTTTSTSYEPLLFVFLHHLLIAFRSPHQPLLQDLALIVYEEKLAGFQRHTRSCLDHPPSPAILESHSSE
jgi:hypothetical protein